MRQWQPNDLFWIVRNGFKYTGHAHWVADRARGRDLGRRRISHSDPKTRREGLSGSRARQCPSVPNKRCRACDTRVRPQGVFGLRQVPFGDEGQWPQSNLVRILHGQPADYLLASLKAYAEGKRRSGIMQPLAADLGPEDMRELADYYAGLPHPQMPSTSETWAVVERGRKLVVEGVPSANVPPCATCHSNVGP